MWSRPVAAVCTLIGVSSVLNGCGGEEEEKEGFNAVEHAWENHFAAFGAQDVEKIMKDYDADSVITLFNDRCAEEGENNEGLAEHKGTDAIKTFFTNLFADLGNTKDTSNIDAVGPTKDGPMVIEGEGQFGNVFLTWRTKNLEGEKQIHYATDSFSFREEEHDHDDMRASADDHDHHHAMIHTQNIVATIGVAGSPACEAGPASPEKPAENPDPMWAAWDNHVEAFLAKDTEKIKKDYTDESIIQVFDWTKLGEEDQWTKHVGVEAIGEFFTDLWDTLPVNEGTTDIKGFEPIINHVQESRKSVLLVWKAENYEKATDTFVFHGDKIVRQNIVVNSKAPPGSVEIV